MKGRKVLNEEEVETFFGRGVVETTQFVVDSIRLSKNDQKINLSENGVEKR